MTDQLDWRHRAVCQDEDPELFFPVGNSGPALLQIAEAKAVCRQCPVVTECLAWALDSGQDFGVWGGMSEDERRALSRRRNPAGRRSTRQGEAVQNAATRAGPAPAADGHRPHATAQ